MAPRATLLAVLVASAVFSIADSNRDLLNYTAVIGDLISQNGGNQIQMTNMIDSEKLIIMQLKAFYKQRVRNPVQKRRIMMIVYIKSADNVRDLFVDLVNHLIYDSSEYLWKFVLDGRNESQLSSLEEYLKESKNKVLSVMNVQLTDTSSNSEAMILSGKDSNVTQTENFKISTKNIEDKYIQTNGIQLVIKLKNGKTDVFEDIIKITKEVKEDIMGAGSCVIESTDIKCKGSKGNIDSSTTPSGIMYVDNGAVCTKNNCSGAQVKAERNCTNGALSGPGVWCEDKPLPLNCDHGGEKIGNYCFLKSKSTHNIAAAAPTQCSQDYPGYSSIKYELFNPGLPKQLNAACAAKSASFLDDLLWTGIADAKNTVGFVLNQQGGTQRTGYSTKFGKGSHVFVNCHSGDKKIYLKASPANAKYSILCFKTLA